MKSPAKVTWKTRVTAGVLFLGVAVVCLGLAGAGLRFVVQHGSGLINECVGWPDRVVTGLLLAFTAGLVPIGCLGAYVCIRVIVWVIRKQDLAATPATAPAQMGAAAQRGLARVVSGGLFIGAAGFLFFLGVHPVLQILMARDWVATPCTVLSSQVEAFRSQQGRTSYAPGILYEYTAGDRRFQGTRYTFAEVASDRYASHQAVAARYPTGATNLCFVHPRDPTRAVLVRGFTADLWWSLVPLGGMVLAAFGWLVSRKT
jgi:hypothetical protein